MPFVANPLPVRLSDLVFHEVDASSRYSRECINVTPAGVLDIGKVVFRAKSSLDPFGAYAVLSNVSQLVDTNEFVVVFGDEYGFNPSFTPKAVQTTTFNAVGFIRGMVQLKDYYIRANNLTMTDAQFNTLKSLLKRQGIVVEESHGDLNV